MSSNDFTCTKIPTHILADDWKSSRCQLSFFMRGGETEAEHKNRVDLQVLRLIKDGDDHFVEWIETFRKTYVSRVIAPPFTIVGFRIRDSY